MGERNELRNRYMLVNPPEALAAPASTPSNTPASTPSSNCSPFTTDNENILRLIKAIGHRQLSLKEMLAAVALYNELTKDASKILNIGSMADTQTIRTKPSHIVEIPM